MTEPKYLYVSSTSHGGPGPGAPVHVPLFDGDTTTVRITEGELKADIATEISGVLTLGLDGLSGPYLSVLEQLKAQSVRLAIDADSMRKRNVALALKETADNLSTKGFNTELELWDEQDGKGIDDLLAAGKTPKVIMGDEVFSTIAKIVEAAKQAQPTDEEKALANAREYLQDLPSKLKADPGFAFEQETLAAFRIIKPHDKPEWARILAVLRKAQISLKDLNEALEPRKDSRRSRTKQESSDANTPPVEPSGSEGDQLTKPLADAITQTEGNHFAQDTGQKLYHYSSGVYRARGEEFIRRRVKALLENWGRADGWSKKLAEEVVEYIRVDAPELWDRPPTNEVNVANGLLNVETRELKPHSPSFLSPIQLPVKFDPHATCPVIDKFVGEVFPEDTLDLAYEIPGVAMVPGEGQEKAILLVGSGGNGKSVYLALVRNFLGKRNTVSVSLHRMESDRFSVSRLVGKLANICPDLPSEHLAGTSMFKSITGKDPITGEYKYKESFDFEPFSRLIFSANHPPQSGDSSQGFFDRWLVVHFMRVFRDTDREIPFRVLEAQLSEPTELSGLLNKALDGLARFRANNQRYTVSASMVAAFDEFRGVTDPLAVWLDSNTVEAPDSIVLKSRLHEAYNEAARRDGHGVLTATAFGTALRKLRPYLRDGQRTVNVKIQWVWIGLGLRSDL